MSSAADEASCVEELNDKVGGLSAVAADAVDRGTATYDAEAAERCTGDRAAAINSCDSQAFAGPTGLSLTRLVFLVDESDAECFALAGRFFTRGTVKDGGDCTADVDCADFGSCVFGDDAFSGAGTCRARTNEGGSCSDDNFIGCAPGLACDSESKCATPQLSDDGDLCVVGSTCKSGFCKSQSACEVGGDSCDFDGDCPNVCVDGLCSDGFSCTVDDECFGSRCVIDGSCATLDITIDVCDGL